MKRIHHNFLAALIIAATLFIPVRLGLVFSAAHAAGVGPSVVGDVPPCHGGDSAGGSTDNCTEHCWRTARANRVATSTTVAEGVQDIPACGYSSVTFQSRRPGTEGFDLDYIGKLVLKRHVSTVILRD